MSLTIHTPPYGDPVALPAIKNSLKVDIDVQEDDELIQSQLAPALGLIETGTSSNVPRLRVMLATTFEVTLDGFPWVYQEGCHTYCRHWAALHMHVPRVPILAVTSITYVDAAGDAQTLSSSKYSVIDAQLGVIALNYNEIWPATQWQPNAVTVRFVAGTCAKFTYTSANVLTVYGRTFTNGDRVQVLNSGGQLPAGLQAGMTYYVISVSGQAFSLSLTEGGSPVAITSAGTEQHYITNDVERTRQFQQAVTMTAAFWYRNREAVVVEPGTAAIVLPMAVESLIGSLHA